MSPLLLFLGVWISWQYQYIGSNQIDIQISQIDSSVMQIHWCASNRVLILTSKGTIYRSEDSGRQWVRMTDLLIRKALMQLETSDERIGSVYDMVASSVD
jgi:hypothetical protein